MDFKNKQKIYYERAQSAKYNYSRGHERALRVKRNDVCLKHNYSPRLNFSPFHLEIKHFINKGKENSPIK